MSSEDRCPTHSVFKYSYPQQISGKVVIRQAGRDGSGAPDDRSVEVEQSDVTVKGEGVEVRMDENLLDLYQLLAWIWTTFVIVS